MATSILVTKLFVPPTRAKLVHRPGLIERLNNGLNRRLTLLSAPAGFGKTTLVSHWVENLQKDNAIDDQHIRVAWLSLDQDDNDPVRFLTYLIVALNQSKDIKTDFGRGAVSMLQSPQPPPPNTVLISLINELATIPEKIVFVLDDYHLIEEKSIHQALVFLLENLPSQLHVVIATRQDPSLSLGRLRARDQLTELRAADLRFTSLEAADFLNQVMGLNLSSGDIAELETRTEGWIAGLQLAAISMRGREDRTGFIKSFTGGNRLVLDFLINEVLGQQPESIHNFLLQTAILDRMTGSLCDALTGQENGQETLEMLDHANLFIVPLDEERRWYRYHHLFGDLLRQRLRQTQAEQLKELHDKASEWFKQNRLFDQAIEHALKGKDFDQAANLIQGQIDVLWQRGEHVKLRRWVQVLPEKLLLTEPQLGIIRAYYLHLIGEYTSAEQLLQRIERILDPRGNGDEVTPSLEYKHLLERDRLKLKGRLSTIRALIYSFHGDVKEIIKQANRALEYLPEQDLTWRNLSAIALGDAHSFLGDIAAAYDARFTALRAWEAEGNIFYILVAALKLASTLREQGELYRTRDLCNDQVRLAEKNNLAEINFVGCIRTILGEVLAEFNDLERAIQHARQGVKIA
ncbi:NACHT domain-containing protein, partial [Candidatus Bathyarchaeota archaeon]